MQINSFFSKNALNFDFLSRLSALIIIDVLVISFCSISSITLTNLSVDLLITITFFSSNKDFEVTSLKKFHNFLKLVFLRNM